MKLIYCTSIAFSDKLGNRAQIHAMSKHFQRKLGDDFALGVNYINQDDENINIVCFNTNKSYRLAWRYLKFIKKNKIKHVYCREARLCFFIIIYNKLFFREKLNYIYEIHALLERGKVDLLVDKFLSWTVNYFILITNKLREMYVKKYSVDINKTIMLSDAVDLDIFDIDISKEEARNKLDLPQDKKILVYTGKFKTMGEDKGISDILKSLKTINNKNILFIAVGGSDKEMDYYRSMAKKIGFKNQAIFRGLTTQNNLALYQKSADILLMPFPYTKHYAFFMSPLKMFEYMASKRPIVTTDLPAIREILNQNNAIIVKPGNFDNLANGINKLLNDNYLSENLSEQAYVDIRKYTWEKRVEKILGFIA